MEFRRVLFRSAWQFPRPKRPRINNTRGAAASGPISSPLRMTEQQPIYPKHDDRDDDDGLNWPRITGITLAIAVHVAALLLLLAPVAPPGGAEDDDDVTRVVIIEPPPPPPPPHARQSVG